MNVGVSRDHQRTIVVAILWCWSAMMLVRTSARLRVDPSPAYDASLIAPIPSVDAITSSSFDADHALQLLEREFEHEGMPPAAAISRPVLPLSSPLPRIEPLTLRGIAWIPEPVALVEGAGLPSGGAMIALNSERLGLTLKDIRGDTAFVTGKDSSWVLVLRSRNQLP